MSNIPGLPPTKIEDLIEREVMQVARAVSEQPLTIKQKRKVEGLTVRLVCRCSKQFPIGYMYQCLYCNEWMCEECAGGHFGKSRKQYRQEKLEGASK